MDVMLSISVKYLVLKYHDFLLP